MSDDLRQGVTPAQHAVLDDVERGRPSWQMMSVNELEQRFELAFLDPPATGIDWRRLAALALHLAERAGSAPAGPITDLAALGLASVWECNGDFGISPNADGLAEIQNRLLDLAGDAIHPVMKLETYYRGADLFAVLVPTAFAEDGAPDDHQLQFHPAYHAALAARLRALGQDAA